MKSFRERAEKAFGDYLDALERALSVENPKASTLEAARKFFEHHGIDLSSDGSEPSSVEQKRTGMLRAIKGLSGRTGTEE